MQRSTAVEGRCSAIRVVKEKTVHSHLSARLFAEFLASAKSSFTGVIYKCLRRCSGAYSGKHE